MPKPFTHRTPASSSPYPPLNPMYTPSTPPLYPLYQNRGDIQGVYWGYTRGLVGDTAGIGGQQWKLTAGVPHSQLAGWGRKLNLGPNTSHPARNANRPAAQGGKVRVKELRKARGWDCALAAIDCALVRLELSRIHTVDFPLNTRNDAKAKAGQSQREPCPSSWIGEYAAQSYRAILATLFACFACSVGSASESLLRGGQECLRSNPPIAGK